MTKRQRRAYGAVGGAAAAALLTAAVVTPAQAADQTANDPAQDVVRVAIPSGNESDAPGNRSVDIRRFTTVYAQRKVRLVTEVRELGEHIAIQYRIRLPDRRLVGYVENEGGTLFFGLSDKEGSEVCGGQVRAGVDDGSDAVRFTFPRRCAGKPRWVRTGARATTGNGAALFYDDARRDGNPDGADIKLGPRVRYN